MGVETSKIDAKQRAKMHRRVSLIEARRQFSKLSKLSGQHLSAASVPKSFPKALNSFPVSQNFKSYFRDERDPKFGKGLVLYLESNNSVELDSAKVQKCTVYHLLKTDYGDEYKVRTVPSIIPENYFIGLYKEQYDALYSSKETAETLPTSSTTSASVF